MSTHDYYNPAHLLSDEHILEGVNNEDVRCYVEGCNKKCQKMHPDQILECLDVYNLTKDIKKSIKLARRFRFDFTMGNQKEIIINENKFTSAGVLLTMGDLLFLFRNSSVILGKPNRGHYYCGMTKGRIETKDELIEDTASRELFEESCKTINISKDVFIANKDNYHSYLDIVDHFKHYRIYLIEISDVVANLRDIYYKNKKNIPDNDENEKYHETDDFFVFDKNYIINRIKVKEFKKIKPEMFPDVSGVDRFIDRKTLQVLYNSFHQYKIPIEVNSYKLEKNENITTVNLFI